MFINPKIILGTNIHKSFIKYYVYKNSNKTKYCETYNWYIT